MQEQSILRYATASAKYAQTRLTMDLLHNVNITDLRLKEKSSMEQAKKAQRGGRVTALLFL